MQRHKGKRLQRLQYSRPQSSMPQNLNRSRQHNAANVMPVYSKTLRIMASDTASPARIAITSFTRITRARGIGMLSCLSAHHAMKHHTDQRSQNATHVMLIPTRQEKSPRRPNLQTPALTVTALSESSLSNFRANTQRLLA